MASLGVAGGPAAGEEVRVRGRLANLRVQGNSAFLVLRSRALHSVQAVFFKRKPQCHVISSLSVT